MPPAVTGTLGDMNESSETCICVKGVVEMLFTVSHHFQSTETRAEPPPGLRKGEAVLLLSSGLFFFVDIGC